MAHLAIARDIVVPHYEWYITCLNGGGNVVCGGNPDLWLLEKKSDDCRVHADGRSTSELHTLSARTENPRPVASPVTGQTECSAALHTQPAVRALDLSLLLLLLFFFSTPQTKKNLY